MSAMPVTPDSTPLDAPRQREPALPTALRSSTAFATFLFWIMAPLGGVCLAATVILPAWLEYLALVDVRVRASERVAALDERLAAADRQIEHLQNDPAYIERIARTEFRLETPGVQSILIEPGSLEGGDLPTNEPDAAPPLSPLVEVGATIEQTIQRYPALSIFVVNPTRYYMMGFSAFVLVTALVLLSPRRPQAIAPLETSTTR